ncbi:hypothetical protein HU200_036546 [Digitaria exilis]|uniref:F-box domain-containing protein n=1 Tax=Digitaria exilis TaxID=1010633 RepID=A0A835BSB3_9POAL|nr:hypothetical protein HU200_036546 [Digitaria exilis]CAB3477618.1 unnamed protein product [Digitaria exilis]
MAAILHKFVDAEQWQAEDTIGRLGILMHASFLLAGFHTYGARPPSSHLLVRRACEPPGSLCLWRLYTAPQLAHRHGADAAVLVVSAQGSEIALLMFLTAGRSDWASGAYLELLHASTVAPLLSRARLGDAEPRASRVCRALADGVCSGLLTELCRWNGLALASLAPLPDDMVVEILRRLADAEDVARVESTCRDMRRVVAERGGELWKPRYEAVRAQRRERRRRWLPSWLFLFGSESSESEEEEEEGVEVLRSWKEKFVEARPRRWDEDGFFRLRFRREFDFDLEAYFALRSSVRLRDLLQDSPEKETVLTKGESSGDRRRRNVARTRDNHRNKWRGAGTGAIHSPSSRYRWKHR